MAASPARLFQVKMEREQHQTEIRDLQDQLSEMHDELDSAKRSEDREKAALIEVRGRGLGAGSPLEKTGRERVHLCFYG